MVFATLGSVASVIACTVAIFFISKFLLKFGSKIRTALIFPFLNSDSMSLSFSI